jgi:signal transduction histidine kinase
MPAGPQHVAVRGNPEQLSQLFLNIVTNAIEAAGPGGSVEVSLRPSEGHIQVRVSDSGPGPPPQVAEQLFEPFVTGKPDGVGLGLAVAREIAQSHGGKIWWERDGGRTVFTVELPLA